MYIVDFFKNLFRKSNIGLIIWMVLNIVLIVAIFSGGFSSWEGILLGIGIYLVSICIALSPIGEWILRLQNGCKKMTDADQIARFEPLFQEVYAQAKRLNPELTDGVKLYITDSEDPNAFATGRKTICVTKGLQYYSDERIKGVLAHEFGHLVHKDTDAILIVAVGNMVVSAIFILIRVFANLFMGIGHFITAVMSEGVGGAIASLFIQLGRIVTDFMLVLLMRMWNQLGIWLCMHSSRGNEYEADAYAHQCGYGFELSEVLESFGESGGAKGLFAALASSHPDNRERINRLKMLGEKQL